ncbi:MAG: pyruvate formate lyase family protein, partial [Niameybacter sp.]
MDKRYKLSPTARFLEAHGMQSAALFYQSLNETVERRAGRVVQFHLQNIDVPTYTTGQRLFATYRDDITVGRKHDDLYDYGCTVDWNGVCWVDGNKFKRLFEEARNEQEQHIVNNVLENARRMYAIPTHTRYEHGGWHHTIDFNKLFQKGLNGYKNEIVEGLTKDISEEKRQFLLGMQDTVEGVIAYVERYKISLKEIQIKNPKDKNLEQLNKALECVPLEPPTQFYEAFVMLQAGLYLSNCFETGRIDTLLYPYYKKDLEEGKVSQEKAYSLFRELFEDMEKRLGHPSAVHVTIGGTDLEGHGSYNTLTQVAIEAIRGLRTPNVTLRVRKDMPQEIWEACLENIGKGYGQPAIANEELFLKGLMGQYEVPFEDAIDYVFGGCSEVMIQGKTMCDSTWVSYNMLDILEDTLHTKFINCESFEAFYSQFKRDLHLTIKDLGEQINIRQHAEGLHKATPVVSLLTGDCLERG